LCGEAGRRPVTLFLTRTKQFVKSQSNKALTQPPATTIKFCTSLSNLIHMPKGDYQKRGKKCYEKNSASYIARVRANNDRLKKEWHDFKCTLACAHCGAAHPAIIDFHHTNRHDPHKQHVNTLIKNKRFTAAYKEVKEKCIVLCANCHRIHHYNEQKNTPEISGAAQGDAKLGE